MDTISYIRAGFCIAVPFSRVPRVPSYVILDQYLDSYSTRDLLLDLDGESSLWAFCEFETIDELFGDMEESSSTFFHRDFIFMALELCSF
jgi:hypothetical protein